MDNTCPKCKELLPDNPDFWNRLEPQAARNSLSRRDNKTIICNTCGSAEALADHHGVDDSMAREWLILGLGHALSTH